MSKLSTSDLVSQEQFDEPQTEGGISRRRLVKGAAWAAPVVAVTIAAPVASASGERTFTITQLGDYSNPAPGALFTGLSFQLSSSDGQNVAFKNFTVSVTNGGSARFNTASGGQNVYSSTAQSDADGRIDIVNLYRRAQGAGGSTNGPFDLTLTPIASDYDPQTEIGPSAFVLTVVDRRSLELATLTNTGSGSAPAALSYPSATANLTLAPSNTANTAALVSNFYLHYLISEGTGWAGSNNPQITVMVTVVSGAKLTNGNPNSAGSWSDSFTLNPSRQTSSPNNPIGSSSSTNRIYRLNDDDIVLRVEASFANTLNSSGTPNASPITTFSREIVIPNPGPEPA